MILGDRLREMGITRWQLAVALGVSESTVIRWLRRPTPKQAELIEAALEAAREVKRL